MKRRDFFPVAMASTVPLLLGAGVVTAKAARATRHEEALQRIADLTEFDHVSEAREIARAALNEED